MLKKLKIKISFGSNKIYFNFKSLFITIFFACLLLFPGGISKAAVIRDALNISLSSQSPKLGENISVNLSVKPEQFSKTSLNKDTQPFVAYISNVTVDSGKVLASQTGKGQSVSSPIALAIKSPDFKAGSNQLRFEITYTVVAGMGVPSVTTFRGETSLNVAAASNVGDPTLNISSSVQLTSSSVRTANFVINYSAGSSGRQAGSYSYDCGNGKTGNVTPPNFSCDYPADIKDYTVNVSAKDSSGVIVSALPYKLSVSGADVSGAVDTGKNASAGVVALINQILGVLIGFLQELIYGIFYWLIAPVIQAMLSIRVYTDAFVAVIYPGWEVIRNICNIFFIVALIVIALATLFRVESYKARPLLIQLILAALMINFSLVIAQAILALADTVQAQFLPANVTVVRSLAGDLMVGTYRDLYDTKAFADGTWSGVVKPLFFLAMSLGSFMVFGAIAVFLVIRVVALWVLLLISPIAYAAGVLPTTAQYRKQWWDNFLKYAFFTPIMAFFLNLTALISKQFRENSILQTVSDPALYKELGDSDLATFVFRVASNVLLLVFLIAALKVADMAGIYGASGITSIAQKGIFAPFAGAKLAAEKAGGFAKKHYDKRTSEWANAGGWRQQAFKVAHPVAFVKAITEEGKKERELYESRVTAGATEVARKQYGWRRKTESPMFIFDEHEGKRLYEEEEGEWSDNEQQIMGIGNRLAKDAQKGDLRAQIKLKHWFTEAFKHKNLNEALEGDNGLANNFLGGKLNYNSNNIRYFFQELTDKGVIDKNFTGEFLKKLSKDAYENNDFNGAELVYSDPKDGHPHMIKMKAVLDASGQPTGDSQPEGWDTYVVKREQLIDQADTEGRAEAARKFGAAATEEQIGVEISKRLGELEKVEAGSNHGYENSMYAERGRYFMKVNMSKRTGTDQVRMFHDSIINIGVVDGKARVSDAGEEVLGEMDMGKMYAMGRDNMPKKTRDKFMNYVDAVVKNEASGLATIETDLKKIITTKFREKGVKLTPAELAKQVAEQRNLWLAAGFSIMSSTPGAKVAEVYFAGKTADDTRAALIAGIKAYNP